MKAPVTTHDLLLLAESKRSCTNVRNSDRRTQTTGTVFVITMRINHGEQLPRHCGCPSLEFRLTDKSSLISVLLYWGAERGRAREKD